MFNYEVRRLKSVLLFLLVFLFLSLCGRSVLLVINFDHITLNLFSILEIYTVGFFYDFVTFSYFIIPYIIYILIISDTIFNSQINKYIIYLFFYIFAVLNVFNIAAEFFFWDEFGVRYNFISIDYLIYTTEVLNNIRESYPINTIVSVVCLISLFIVLFLKKHSVIITNSKTTLLRRTGLSITLLVIPFLCFFLIDTPVPNISDNTYENNIAANGIYCLFSAFRNNMIDYYDFYATFDDKDVFSNIKKIFPASQTSSEISEQNSVTRKISSNNPEKKYNIILVVIESMSSEFMSAYGNKNNLTPNLDLLAENGIFYKNLYATGTRTIRGLESITLSFPPLPGQSIIKRQKNENIDFCISKVFGQKGYDMKFIYGGYGYFDNMNYFFSHNGFNTLDRSDIKSTEVTFTNAWGVCDEDLFNKTIKESDRSYSQNKPFLSILMTTSNHRPFTFPENKVKYKSGSGRDGAVNYCDYAIGRFINEAKKQKWFDNTLFIFTADHCASSAGRAKLSIEKYKIPMIIYAPKIIQPAKIEQIISQIDIAPIIFDLLDWSYTSNFFGRAISTNSGDTNRVFISNYQKLGYMKNDTVVVLEPKKKISTYKINPSTYELLEIPENKKLTFDAITYYQSASYLYKKSIGAKIK